MNYSIRMMCRYLQEEAIDKTKKSLAEISGTAEWEMVVMNEWNQQDNLSDCGVFMSVGCECVALEMEMMMRSDKALFFRQKMGVDIIKGKLT